MESEGICRTARQVCLYRSSADTCTARPLYGKVAGSATVGAGAMSLDNCILIYKYEYIFMPELSNFTAEFFKALSHPLRIRILDALRKGEVGVNELSTRLEVEQTTLSQQLAVLRKSNIVNGRKEGQNVYYSARDAEIFRLLDVARRIFNNQLVDVRDLLAQLSPPAKK